MAIQVFFFLDILISEAGLFFVNAPDLFNTLKIPAEVKMNGDRMEGNIGVDFNSYTIDIHTKTITMGTEVYSDAEGIVNSGESIFIESNLLSRVFGIRLNFHMRSLTANLTSSFELPVLKLMRLKKQRENIRKIQGEFVIDTTLFRNKKFFHGGTFDWQVGGTQQTGRAGSFRTKFDFGAELLYGEAEIGCDYISNQHVKNNNLNVHWRWVENNTRIVRQVQLGRIQARHLTFHNAPLWGGSINNKSTVTRKATGHYMIRETTEPGWDVELYVNNLLVDFTQADSTGNVCFSVPNVYGLSIVKLIFYGPHGEEKILERTRYLPVCLLPVKEFEYCIVAGLLQNEMADRFVRADFQYGLFRNLTIGGGVEHLSSLNGETLVPFLSFNFKQNPGFSIQGDYVHRVRTAIALNLLILKYFDCTLEYNLYKKGQKVIPFMPLEEWKAGIYFPIRFKYLNSSISVDYLRQRLTELANTQANVNLSLSFWNFNLTGSAQINWIGSSAKRVFNTYSLSYQIFNNISARFRYQFAFSEDNGMNFFSEIEKRWEKGTLNLSFGRHFGYKRNSVTLSFFYNLPFSRISKSVALVGDQWAFSQWAQGGTAFGSGNNYIYVNSDAQTGKGGLSLYPFLDVNHNMKFDSGEKMVRLYSLRILSNKVVFRNQDSVIRLPDLTPFISYILEFDDKDLENIAWRFAKKTWSVIVDPNQFKRIDIPILPFGEINGYVTIDRDGEQKGLQGVLINFIKEGAKDTFSKIMTESDGYFSFLGFPPGSYTAQVDLHQLSRLGLQAEPAQRGFIIREVEEGEIVEGIDFLLK